MVYLFNAFSFYKTWIDFTPQLDLEYKTIVDSVLVGEIQLKCSNNQIKYICLFIDVFSFYAIHKNVTLQLQLEYNTIVDSALVDETYFKVSNHEIK